MAVEGFLAFWHFDLKTKLFFFIKINLCFKRRWAYVTGSKFLDAVIVRKRLLDESDSDEADLKAGRSQVWTQEALDWVNNEASRQTGIPDAFKVKKEILVDISVLGLFIKVSSYLLINDI